MTEYRIYFDQVDEDLDPQRRGWNVVDDGCVAVRFRTEAAARAWAINFYGKDAS